jgi:hypothetical protein
MKKTAVSVLAVITLVGSIAAVSWIALAVVGF